MKFIIGSLALATVASAQLSAFPTCALTALAALVPASGCAPTDTKCLCTSPAFANAGPAIVAACPDPAAQAQAASAAAVLCAPFTAVVATPTPTPTPSTTSPTVSPTSTPSTTTTRSTTTSGAPGVVTVVATSFTTVCPCLTSSTSTRAANLTATFTPTVFTGAAASPFVNLAAAGLMGVAALLAF